MNGRSESTVEASAIPAAQRSRFEIEREEADMMKHAVVVMVLALGIAGRANAQEGAVLARFDGGIGVIPVQNGAGPVNAADGTFPNVKLNIVRGVSPGAGPWRIDELKAVVYTSGRIRVKGRGLLLASTDSIGGNAGQSVFATLICEATLPFTQHNTFSVPLDPNGDFRIDEALQPTPGECASPVLLIRNKGGVWFAAGIPKIGDN
jgi:hypothetical protein